MVKSMSTKFCKAGLPWKKSGFILTIGLLMALMGGCDSKPAAGEQKGPLPPVSGIVTTFEDEVKDLPGDQIAWSAFWKFCWQEYPKARSYELQVITSEGTSPKLRSRKEPCFRIQVAAGTNPKEQGMLNRDKLMELQIGQLSYRVRAVLGENRYSDWSRVITLKGQPEP